MTPREIQPLDLGESMECYKCGKTGVAFMSKYWIFTPDDRIVCPGCFEKDRSIKARADADYQTTQITRRLRAMKEAKQSRPLYWRARKVKETVTKKPSSEELSTEPFPQPSAGPVGPFLKANMKGRIS